MVQQDLIDNIESAEGELSQIYRSVKSPAPIFTPDIWKDVGHSLLYALLDYEHVNPITRLVHSKNESLEEPVDRIRQKLKENIEIKAQIRSQVADEVEA